ncbi:hypothetical protein [Sphingobacterium thalpophilum]|uniref:Uncharacterized protein n=1 Tax=Sphingobacterium thalpophilum TaxID=259 RepID=A0A4U9VP46_9SPHI|nr:hypothetical protein [Sphingobacterium thalpophilum]VTR49095.1 Uncharacterised protein [Sphingobacterium thalpophilum]
MDDKILIALISAGTSIATTIIFKPFAEKGLLLHKIKYEHQSSQAKLVKEHIAKYKSRLLSSAESLRNRFINLFDNNNEEWHNVNGNYENDSHYLDSTVYRFVSFFHALKMLENNLIYLDPTNSTKSDLRILKYIRLAKDVMCDIALFEGFPYDKTYAKDHFFSTPLDATIALFEESCSLSFTEFMAKKQVYLSNLRSIYQFFDDINLSENRLRMERIKILHLLLIGFLNEYGYDFHKTSRNEIKDLKGKIGKFKLLENYVKLRYRYRLNKLYWIFPQMEICAAR